jgi:hypothetical protein
MILTNKSIFITRDKFVSSLLYSSTFKFFIKIDEYPKRKKIFLILSGSLKKIVINELNNYPQIFSICIYCYDEREYKTCSKNHSKIVGIVIGEHELVTQIAKDQTRFM